MNDTPMQIEYVLNDMLRGMNDGGDQNVSTIATLLHRVRVRVRSFRGKTTRHDTDRQL